MATGFDPKFLSTQVSLPAMSGAAADDAVVVNGSSVIDYTHFSLALSASRRLARWVAWNVDGKRMQKLSRSSMKFRLDRRVPPQMQVGDELYSDNRIDHPPEAVPPKISQRDPASPRAHMPGTVFARHVDSRAD